MDNVFLAEYDNYIFIALAIAGWLFKTFRSSFSKPKKEEQSLAHKDQIENYADQKVEERYVRQEEKSREISPIEQYLMELESQGHNVSEIMDEIEEDDEEVLRVEDSKTEVEKEEPSDQKREPKVIKKLEVLKKRAPSSVKRRPKALPELKKKENLKKAFIYSEIFKTKF